MTEDAVEQSKENMKNKRCLVSGNCGFIGHHLVKVLKQQDCYVYGVDNLSNGKEEYALFCDGFKQSSVQNLQVLPEDLDAVYHLAALPRVPFSIRNPELTNDNNLNTTLHLLELARKAKVKRFVYASSSSVYGDQAELPLRESVQPRPMNPYAIQKLAGEMYCRFYARYHGLSAIALRYFNVYGEDQDGSHPYATAVAKFLDRYRKGEPLPIYGDGSKTRDMTYVGDVVDATIKAGSSTRGGVFNIGSGKEYAILDIAKAISDKITFLPDRQGEAERTQADIWRAKGLLGWQPKTDVFEWIKTQL